MTSPSCCPRTYALTLLEEFQGLRVVLDTVATTVMSALGRSAKWQQALLATEEEAQPLDVTLGIQVMDDRFGIETHGDLGIHHFEKLPMLELPGWITISLCNASAAYPMAIHSSHVTEHSPKYMVYFEKQLDNFPGDTSFDNHVN